MSNDNYKNLLKNTLGQDSFWQINKVLLQIVGIDAALLLSDLIDKWIYFDNKKMLDTDGCFFNTAENIENDTTLSAFRQRKALKILINLGIIYTDNKTVGNRSRFRIEENQLLNLLNSRSEEIKHLKINKLDNSYNNNKEIIINNNNKIKEKNNLKKESDLSYDASLNQQAIKKQAPGGGGDYDFTKWSEDQFKEKILHYRAMYSIEILKSFFEYWTERDKKGVMRFQLQKTYSVGGRLATWKRNNDRFASNEKVTGNTMQNAAVEAIKSMI